MRLLIDNRDPDFILTPDWEAELQRALDQALQSEGISEDVEISLSFVDADEIHQLNRDYRGVDAETDVLSFPLHEAEEVADLKARQGLGLLGDIVINRQRVLSQAQEYGHPEREEAVYLAIHSLLHLLGYDHEIETDKRVMRAREEAIMEALGFDRPAPGEAGADSEPADAACEPADGAEPAAAGPEAGVADATDLTAEADSAAGGADLAPEADPAFHSGFVALLGRTNVGKSTFANALMEQKLCLTSSRVQATRNAIHLIYTDERMQLVLTDTPGIQNPRNALGKAMLKASLGALEGADLVLFITDTSPKPGPIDQAILDKLASLKGSKKILLLNKIDLISPEEVKALVDAYRAMAIFDQILPISALTGQGMGEVKEALYQLLPPGPLYYPEDMVTDRSERFVITEIIREKCLENLKEEIPYGIYVTIEDMKYREDRDLADIQATIHIEREAHKAIVIGREGRMLKKIGTQAREEIEDLIGCQANLKLWVKPDPGWRKKEGKVQDLGY